MSNNSSEHKKFFRHFLKLGILLGGVVPIFFFFLTAYFIGIKDFAISINGFNLVLIFLSSVLITTIVLLFNEDNRNEKWFKRTELVQALSCFVLTAIIIHNTGGSRNSVFSFTCLYIPSVVGYVYGKKDRSLIGAAVAMSLIYILNLAWTTNCALMKEQELYKLDVSRIGLIGPIDIEIIYAILFLLQLYIVFEIASQKDDLRNPEEPVK